MNQSENVYKVERDNDAFPEILRYYFASKGKRHIIKAIEYQYVSDFEGYAVFNLAFGNHQLKSDTISDEDICNNGDHYKVLSTVLHTIPLLFETYGNVMLVVEGSDSNLDFVIRCKLQCSRKCDTGDCKMAHRRINIYRTFVDRNFEQLNNKYLFWGGNKISEQQLIEPYCKGKKYDMVYVRKKS